MASFDPSGVFMTEARELLVQLEQAFLELEQRPDDRNLVDTAFRALHTLKGSGGMFGPAALAGFAHEVESVFEGVRQGHEQATPALIGAMLAATDHLRLLLEQPDRVDPTITAGLSARLLAATSAGTPGGTTHGAADVGHDADSDPAAVTPAEPAAAGAAPSTWRIMLALSPSAIEFGTNPLALLDELRELGHCTVRAIGEAVPDLTEIEPATLYMTWEVILVSSASRHAIEDVFIFVMEDGAITVEPLAEAAVEAARTGQPTDSIDAASATLAEVSAGSAAAPPPMATAPASEPAPPAAAKPATQGAPSPKPAARVVPLAAEPAKGEAPAKPEASVRVPASRLDSLLDQVGELVIAQARLTALAHARKDPALTSVVEEVERLSAELRDSTMGMRMLPIGTLFGRYRRVVRDLSQELGKEIDLSTEGEATELDKTVIDRLGDPLVHLIRNSIDHGIEPAEVRLAAGKTRAGKLRLEARQSGAEVLITIRDDGAGLNRTRIRDKAVAAGLIAADAQLADRELDQLIFHAGLSTAAAVTNVSGRGVGMDVVKRTIEELRGAIEVSSTPGVGTRLTLRLPLTLAIIDGLLVRVGQRMCVVPLSAVEECVELAAAEHRGSSGRNFLAIRGALVPFVRLHGLFGGGGGTSGDGHDMVVIVSSDQGRVGLVVDQVVGQHQTVIKPLSPLHRGIEGLAGATIMGDGRVALILDIGSLILSAQALTAQPIAA